MFFYILYVNDAVVGFAEYGYLPQSEALLIDYICTRPRNHTYFYTCLLYTSTGAIYRFLPSAGGCPPAILPTISGPVS